MNARISLVVVALLGGACVPEEGPLMAAHQDCLTSGCHSDGEGKTWTVAGTMGGQGSRIVLTGADGRSFTIRAAQNGNFYTAESLAFDYTVSVDGKPMAYVTASRGPVGQVIPVSYGGCNACHLADGSVVEFDEFMLPGSDCLSCHRAGGMARNKIFSAAGTWSGAGITVRIAGQTKTTNRVGNFFFEAPIQFPTAPTVGGRTMDDPPADYGGCNRCHPFGREAGD